MKLIGQRKAERVGIYLCMVGEDQWGGQFFQEDWLFFWFFISDGLQRSVHTYIHTKLMIFLYIDRQRHTNIGLWQAAILIYISAKAIIFRYNSRFEFIAACCSLQADTLSTSIHTYIHTYRQTNRHMFSIA